MPTRNTIFTVTTPFVIIPSRASESSGEAICRPCGVIIPASHPASRSGGFSDMEISGSRNTHHLPGTTRIHGEYYGVSKRQGRPRNPVFCGSLRDAGLADAMGSAHRVGRTENVTPH